jgi:hypothetical protein
MGRAVPARQGGEGCRRRAAANEFLADMRDADVRLERLVGVMAGRKMIVEPGDDVEWRVDGPTILRLAEALVQPAARCGTGSPAAGSPGLGRRP